MNDEHCLLDKMCWSWHPRLIVFVFVWVQCAYKLCIEFSFSKFSLRNQFLKQKTRQWDREQNPNYSAKSFTYQSKKKANEHEYMLVECKTPKIKLEWIYVDHRITPKNIQLKFCLDTGLQLNAFEASKQACACMYGVYLFNRNWIFTHHLILQCFVSFFFYMDFESTRFPHIFIFTHISHSHISWLAFNRIRAFHFNYTQNIFQIIVE